MANWGNFVAQYAPFVLRDAKLLDYVTALLSPLADLQTRFENYRKKVLIIARTTPQVCVLRGALNDIFDPTNRRIKIEDSSDADYDFIYRTDENLPLFLPIFLHQTGGVGDFVVRVPVSVANSNDNLQRIKDFVTLYKLPTMRFVVVQF